MNFFMKILERKVYGEGQGMWKKMLVQDMVLVNFLQMPFPTRQTIAAGGRGYSFFPAKTKNKKISPPKLIL